MSSTYSYGIDPSGSGVLKQPHTLTDITSDSTATDTDATMGYDDTGNTTSRTYGGDTQTLTWTWDGKAEKVSGFGQNGKGQVIGLEGKCLDLTGAESASGTAVQLYSCNGTKAQRFRIDPAKSSDATTGALKILGKCVAPTGGATADHTAITLTDCTGATNQQWTATSSHTLKHVASGKCLDVPSGNSADGTDLQLLPCGNGSSAQQWTFADETTYVYDASGNRLISSTVGGRTLSLDDAELTTDAAGAPAYCQRYYGQAGAPTVMRHSQGGSASSKLIAMVTDDHGTAVASVSLGAGQDIVRQKTDPFGVERGTGDGKWLSHRGYLGGSDDAASDLTHLGAREYDASTGRFISADPVLDIGDPMSMNGYAYADNNPVTFSDPSGRTKCDVNPELCHHGPYTKETPDSGNSDPAPSGSSSTGQQTVTITVTRTITVTTPPVHCDWWCKASGWVHKHKEIVSFVTEVVVGAACVGAAVGGSTVTAGASLTAVTGCGALAGAAGSAVNNALDPDADHSALGTLGDEVDGAAWGAATSLVGDGLGKVTEKGAAKLVSKIFGNKGGTTVGCLHSFPSGTEVLLADGKHKPIEDVEIGDTVATTDVDSGKPAEKKVASTITTEDDKDFTKLTIGDGHAMSTLIATDTHPFWVPKLDKWIPAGDLHTGQLLRTSAGTLVQITAITRFSERQRTHDLTVTGIHAYYVLAGATPVLVHNCGEGIATLHYHGDGNHFSIEVTDGKKVRHTHLMPHDGEAVVSPYSGPPSIMSRDVVLPNAKAALEFQEKTQGSWGKYQTYGNSCLTYCTNVLREGGVDAPEGRAAVPWVRKFLSGGQ
ncbi:ricin-type beta-trefoil lectin domain protein [Streptomyces sp. A 4/2]|uniref:ricin-type beta-trefoil lectin domain protein n=1 Tax=Streptomyces sp. A 4/2 TaxID=2934314 RepID=UPI002024A05E|nr:ricin-type beta-trefoil lectin domain protein [Streptomyces sp. A 4/2]